MRRTRVAVLAAVVVVGSACSGGDGDGGGDRSAAVQQGGKSTATTATPSTTAAPAVTAAEPAPAPATAPPPATTAPTRPPAPVTTAATAAPKPPTPVGVPANGVLVAGDDGAALADRPGGPVTGRLRAGVTVAYTAVAGNWAHILSPCENRAWTRLDRGTRIVATDVVVDAGHGGDEPGAVGPSGLTEKALNLDISRRVVDRLAAEGVQAVLTRPSDYRVTISSRVAIAGALKPRAFISVHHNAEPDEIRTGPGSETYYQVRSPDSKRLSGLLYEEIVAALAAFPAEWMGDRDAGAKTRLNLEGGDYYGILRRSAEVGVPASLVESAFISNPSEDALLARDDVRDAEAAAITRGLLRYLRGTDPGTGFVDAYVRHAPAGGGGGSTGCVDPS